MTKFTRVDWGHPWRLTDEVYPAQKFESEFNLHPRAGLAEILRREVAWYRGQAEKDAP